MKQVSITHKKVIVFVIAIAFLITSCQNSSKLLFSGQYDFAMTKAIKEIKKNKRKTRDKEIDMLELAYKKANEKDRAQIEYLKKEGRPDTWDEIFNKYSCLRDRQNIVAPLLPLKKSNGQVADIQLVNYDSELITAKQNAAEYYYTAGSNLLANNKTRQAARVAYYDFVKVKQYYGNYKDVDQKMNQAKYEGTNQVMFVMRNNTNMIIPVEFERELLKISLQELNQEWVNYNTTYDSTRKYDYGIAVNLKVIDATPELVDNNMYTNTVQVEDGFQYVLDAKGNVKKDTAGNDIKVPKYANVTCSVKETLQRKKVMVSGTLDFINISTAQVLKSDPITAESIFEHRSGFITGDVRALKPEHKNLAGSTPIPFPATPAMIMQANQTLKNMVKDIIWNNKYLFN